MEKTIKKLENFNGDILIFTHENPDGDGIGSMLALYKFLTKKGKKVEMAMKDQLPYIYNFLANADKIKKLPNEKEYDLAILVDAAGKHRAGTEVKAKQFLRIDHHRGGDKYSDADLVDTSSPSTTTLIAKLLKHWDEKLVDKDIAESLYTGLLTDTGSFRYSNITSETFEIAKFLVEKGVDPVKVSQYIFERNKPEVLELLQKTLSTLELYENNQVSSLVVKDKFFKETGAKEEDTEGFVNYAKGIDGVKVAFLMIEKFNDKNEKFWRVSLRSKNDINVEKIASRLGGGGHKNAAGCRIKGEEKEVKEKILKEIKKELEKEKSED